MKPQKLKGTLRLLLHVQPPLSSPTVCRASRWLRSAALPASQTSTARSSSWAPLARQTHSMGLPEALELAPAAHFMQASF